MTLNGVIAVLSFFIEFDSFAGQLAYVTVVEDRPIMSVNIVRQFQLSYFFISECTETGPTGSSQSSPYLLAGFKLSLIHI